MSTLGSQVKAYLHTCRYEYFPGEAPAMLVPLLLCSSSFSDMFTPELMAGLVAFLLLFLSGFTINAYTDRKIDENYDSFKQNIAGSVKVLGARRLLHLTIAQVVVAMVISAWISWRMGEWLLYALVLVGVFFGIGYSVKPLNFKERGSIWHAVALGTSIFFIPLLFLYWIAAGELTLFIILLAAGFSLVHYAMEYGNQANDYLEDRAARVMTPPVRLGITRSLLVALWMFLMGAIIVAYSFHFLIFNNVALVDHYSALSLWAVVLTIWGILAAGYYLPTRGLLRMYTISAASDDIERDMPAIKQQCHYSRWQTSGIVGLLFVSFIIFGTNMVVLDVSVEPVQGAHFSDPPTVNLVNTGNRLFPDYYVDLYIFIRSDDIEVKGNTLQVRITLAEGTHVYETHVVNVTHRLLPRETWTHWAHLDAREYATTTMTFMLIEDEDGDDVYETEIDKHVTSIRVYPDRGFGGAADGDDGLPTDLDLPVLPGDLVPKLPWDGRH